jgi:hypothetical protein
MIQVWAKLRWFWRAEDLPETPQRYVSHAGPPHATENGPSVTYPLGRLELLDGDLTEVVDFETFECEHIGLIMFA